MVNLLLSALRAGTAPAESLTTLYLLVLDHASMYLVDSYARWAPRSDLDPLRRTRRGIQSLPPAGCSPAREFPPTSSTQHAEQAVASRLRKISASPIAAEFLALPVEAIEGVLDVWDAHEGGVRLLVAAMTT